MYLTYTACVPVTGWLHPQNGEFICNRNHPSSFLVILVKPMTCVDAIFATKILIYDG